MDLLSLLNVGIVLSDSLESELVHQVDGVGVVAVAILPGEGRGERVCEMATATQGVSETATQLRQEAAFNLTLWNFSVHNSVN